MEEEKKKVEIARKEGESRRLSVDSTKYEPARDCSTRNRVRENGKGEGSQKGGPRRGGNGDRRGKQREPKIRIKVQTRRLKKRMSKKNGRSQKENQVGERRRKHLNLSGGTQEGS